MSKCAVCGTGTNDVFSWRWHYLVDQWVCVVCYLNMGLNIALMKAFLKKYLPKAIEDQ